MDCDDLAEVAAELALGVLTGRERAQAIMHLDRCGTCRERIRDLALTEEELLGLLPGREPPAGFETRVMGLLGFTGRHRRRPPGRPRWMLAAAAGAVIAVAAGLGGWGLRGAGGYGHWGSPEPLPPAAVTGARLATADGKALATASFSPPG